MPRMQINIPVMTPVRVYWDSPPLRPTFQTVELDVAPGETPYSYMTRARAHLEAQQQRVQTAPPPAPPPTPMYDLNLNIDNQWYYNTSYFQQAAQANQFSPAEWYMTQQAQLTAEGFERGLAQEFVGQVYPTARRAPIQCDYEPDVLPLPG